MPKYRGVISVDFDGDYKLAARWEAELERITKKFLHEGALDSQCDVKERRGDKPLDIKNAKFRTS
jgi:hypothetical protein